MINTLLNTQVYINCFEKESVLTYKKYVPHINFSNLDLDMSWQKC